MRACDWQESRSRDEQERMEMSAKSERVGADSEGTKLRDVEEKRKRQL